MARDDIARMATDVEVRLNATIKDNQNGPCFLQKPGKFTMRRGDEPMENMHQNRQAPSWYLVDKFLLVALKGLAYHMLHFVTCGV